LIWIANALGLLGRLIPRLEEKAEYARIGHYYATESMLVWDPKTQRYDEGATPSFGNDRLEDHYRLLLREP
jgi:divinyl chlorophyllide a 8-vinyl-reductase